MHGIDGNDVIIGGEGDDHLYGNAGDDYLTGGPGKDFLVGGSGADVYIYLSVNDSTFAQRDTIENFTSNEDQLDLRLLNLDAQDITITSENGIVTLAVNDSEFAIDMIVSDPITTDDILM